METLFLLSERTNSHIYDVIGLLIIILIFGLLFYIISKVLIFSTSTVIKNPTTKDPMEKYSASFKHLRPSQKILVSLVLLFVLSYIIPSFLVFNKVIITQNGDWILKNALDVTIGTIPQNEKRSIELLKQKFIAFNCVGSGLRGGGDHCTYRIHVKTANNIYRSKDLGPPPYKDRSKNRVITEKLQNIGMTQNVVDSTIQPKFDFYTILSYSRYFLFSLTLLFSVLLSLFGGQRIDKTHKF